MKDHVGFQEVLELFESYGWKFMGFWTPYRVFVKPDEPDDPPWLIPVHDRKIDIEYVKKFKRWLKRKGLLRNEDED